MMLRVMMIMMMTMQVSVEGEPHEKAVELLKAALSSVKLVVRFILTNTTMMTNTIIIVMFVVCRYHPCTAVMFVVCRYHSCTADITQVHTKGSGGDGAKV